ncbi:MAG: hypothetical protein DRG78_02585 [Epsilonproteobacteria bacterium]|nr:MAG: hypothetical protein DRG78_02585 [Campylobacterota bacterium]
MKKIILVLMCVGLLQAKIYRSSLAYFDNGGNKDKELLALLQKDDYYISGNVYLQDKKDIKVQKKIFSEPDNPIDIENLPEILVPQWDKTLPMFIKSAKVFNNPVSAYQGLFIINSFYGKQSKTKEFKELATVLYNNEKNICMSHIFYGEIFEKGYNTKVDKQKALSIYLEADKSMICKGWESSVLGGRIYKLQRELK